MIHDNVIDFGQHETQLLLMEDGTALGSFRSAFKLVDINAGKRAPGMPVFKFKYAQTYHIR